MTSSHRLALLTAAAVLAGPAAASAAPTTVEALKASTQVTSYGGTAMWSRLDAATGKYQLVQSVDGAAPVAVPVAESPVPFDVDLGTNRSASVYAVYSRDGDIYRLNPRSGVEEHLTSISSPVLREHAPTIQRGRIAFLREEFGDQQLRVADSTSRPTRLLVKSPTLRGVELSNQQVSYLSQAGSEQRVHVRNVTTGSDRVVYSARSGGASFVVVGRPSFTTDQSGFVFTSTRIGAPGSRIVKYTLKGSRLSYATGSSRYASASWLDDTRGAVVSTSLDAAAGTGTANCSDAGVNYCNVLETGPLTFSAKP